MKALQFIIILSTIVHSLCFRSLGQCFPHQPHTCLQVQTKSIEGSSMVGIEATSIASKRSAAKKYKDLSAKERTGYEYTQAGIEYDVPHIAEPKWYRILVRKNSESTLCDVFSKDVEKNEMFKGKVVDAFYPKSVLMKFKGRRESGKGLSITHKPMIPGLLFIKTAMSADIADDIESVSGVRGFVKDLHGLVVPLSAEEVTELDILRAQGTPAMDEEVGKLRIGEYVTVVGGRHQGKYGIIEGTTNGKIEVRLRSEYRDSQDSIEVEHLRYLENPPEVNYKDMTPKQAVESLLVKEPNGQMLRFLRKEGLLNQILHPERAGSRERQFDGRPGGGRSWSSAAGGDVDSMRGREGGRSIRSIAKKETHEVSAPTTPRGGGDALHARAPSSTLSTRNAQSTSADAADEDPLEAFLQTEKTRPTARILHSSASATAPTRAESPPPKQAMGDRVRRGARLEDFASFEDYLQALVAEDKQRAGKAGTSTVDGAANLKPTVREMADSDGEAAGTLVSCTVKELKERCKERWLATSGTKAELLSRLSTRPEQ